MSTSSMALVADMLSALLDQVDKEVTLVDERTRQIEW